MTTTTDRRLRSPEYNLEIGTDTPNLRLILAELEKGIDYANRYGERNARAYNSWHSRWDGQTVDGRKHSVAEAEDDVFPFEGASDTRIRTVKQCIKDHVMVCQAAFDNAKVQAEAARPFAQGAGRQLNKVGQLLKWQTTVQLHDELALELELAFNWRCGYGAALLGVDWWQCRRLETYPLTVPILAQIVMARAQAEGTMMDPGQALFEMQEALADPAMFDSMVAFVQSLSPIVTKGEARKAIEDLQQLRNTEIRIPAVFRSQPRITALKPGVDVLFLDITGDLQQEPWFAWRERISETDLYDRIDSDGYDSKFVEEAIRQKGRGSDDTGLLRTLSERTEYSGYADRPGWVSNYAANTIDLYHFFYKAHVRGVPALFRTIFNPAVTSRDLKNPLVAFHGLHPYDHGMYPATSMRFETEERPILSSQGIAEQAYTWQQEEKALADAQVDRNAMEISPPLVGPISRQGQITGSPLPRGYIGVTRPSEFNWFPPMPPNPSTVQIMERVARRVQRFFPLFGPELDPDLKNAYRAQLGKKIQSEAKSMYVMMFALDQQYWPDADVEQVVGDLPTKFQVSPEEIRAKHRISVTFDVQMLNENYRGQQIDLVIKLLGSGMNQGGTWNINRLGQRALELVNPDLVDEIVQDEGEATDKETNEELDAISRAFNGLESPLPMHANHKLRLQEIMKQVLQNQNPAMQKRLAENPDALEIIQKRVQFHENQIQQYEQNPGIGRALTTRPFSNEAPALQAPGG